MYILRTDDAAAGGKKLFTYTISCECVCATTHMDKVHKMMIELCVRKIGAIFTHILTLALRTMPYRGADDEKRNM